MRRALGNVTPNAASSNAQERLCQAGHQTPEAQGRVGGRKADAIGTDIGHGRMVKLFIGHLDITCAEMIGRIAEGTLENQS